jgi:Arc/MetJ-type ribon-helix-helix transcriptional regulator
MKRISIHIEEEYLEWLDSRPGNRAEAIRYAIARYYRFVREVERERERLEQKTAYSDGKE